MVHLDLDVAHLHLLLGLWATLTYVQVQLFAAIFKLLQLPEVVMSTAF